jgi:hypothetical protein
MRAQLEESDRGKRELAKGYGLRRKGRCWAWWLLRNKRERGQGREKAQGGVRVRFYFKTCFPFYLESVLKNQLESKPEPNNFYIEF